MTTEAQQTGIADKKSYDGSIEQVGGLPPTAAQSWTYEEHNRLKNTIDQHAPLITGLIADLLGIIAESTGVTLASLKSETDELSAILLSDDSTLDTAQERVDRIKQIINAAETLTIADVAGLQTYLNSLQNRAQALEGYISDPIRVLWLDTDNEKYWEYPDKHGFVAQGFVSADFIKQNAINFEGLGPRDIVLNVDAQHSIGGVLFSILESIHTVKFESIDGLFFQLERVLESLDFLNINAKKNAALWQKMLDRGFAHGLVQSDINEIKN